MKLLQILMARKYNYYRLYYGSSLTIYATACKFTQILHFVRTCDTHANDGKFFFFRPSHVDVDIEKESIDKVIVPTRANSF